MLGLQSINFLIILLLRLHQFLFVAGLGGALTDHSHDRWLLNVGSLSHCDHLLAFGGR